MKELLLEQAELLALLDGIGAHAIVSISPAHLFPENSDERSAVIKQGTTSLMKHGLLQVDSQGRPVMDDQLYSLINTVAFPKIAALVVSNDRQKGLKRYWFYQTECCIVEHTISGDQLHRMAVLSDAAALINRMEDVLTIENTSSDDVSIEMEQKAFFQVNDLAKSHELESAREMLQNCGCTSDDITALLHVLEHPRAAGNIAFLRCASETVIDARNIALLQDRQSTWLARQKVPGVEVLVVETTDIPAIKKQMLSYFNELAQ